MACLRGRLCSRCGGPRGDWAHADGAHEDTLVGNCAVVAGGRYSTSASINVTCGPTAAEIKTMLAQIVSERGLTDLLEAYRSTEKINAEEVAKLSARPAPDFRPDPDHPQGRGQGCNAKHVLDQFAYLTSQYVNTAAALSRLPVSAPPISLLAEQAKTALQRGDVRTAAYLARSADGRLLPPNGAAPEPTDVNGEQRANSATHRGS